MKKGTSGQERQYIAAPPEVVYDVISDVTRMGEWSPECVACEWIDGATGPSVGARFRGQNRHGRARWANKPRVVVADRATEFAFVATDPRGRDMTRWTYRLEGAEGGTDLVESFELLNNLPLYLRLTDRFVMKVRDRQADLQANMRQTLAKIKAATEQGDPPPR